MKDLSKKELLWYLPIFYFILLALWAFVDNVVNARTQVGNFLIPSIVLLALLLTKNYWSNSSFVVRFINISLFF